MRDANRLRLEAMDSTPMAVGQSKNMNKVEQIRTQ